MTVDQLALFTAACSSHDAHNINLMSMSFAGVMGGKKGANSLTQKVEKMSLQVKKMLVKMAMEDGKGKS